MIYNQLLGQGKKWSVILALCLIYIRIVVITIGIFRLNPN